MIVVHAAGAHRVTHGGVTFDVDPATGMFDVPDEVGARLLADDPDFGLFTGFPDEPLSDLAAQVLMLAERVEQLAARLDVVEAQRDKAPRTRT